MEEGQMLEKVHQFVLVFDLDLLEETLVDILADDGEVAVGQTLDGGGTGFVVDQSEFTEGLTHSQLDHLEEERHSFQLLEVFILAERLSVLLHHVWDDGLVELMDLLLEGLVDNEARVGDGGTTRESKGGHTQGFSAQSFP
jgi:hypothetical protein